MILAFLSIFFKCVATLLNFAVNLIIALIQSILVFLQTGITEWIRLSKERKAKNAEQKAENEKFKTTTESTPPKDGKFVLLELIDSEWHPVDYYQTYMEAYTAKIMRRAVPHANPMIVQEIK